MKSYALPLLLVAALSGCASSTPVMGPSGKTNHSIRCGAALINACYEKAAELCPKGYDVVDRPTRMVGPNLMMIECKA